MEDLRLAIIVLGVFSILGILIHGLWTIRKNAASKEPETEHGRDNPSERDELSGQHAMEQVGEAFSTASDPLNDAPLINDPLLNDSIANDPLMDEPQINTSDSVNSDTPAFTAHSPATPKHEYSAPDINIADTPLHTDSHVPDINLDIPKEPVIRTDDGGNSNYDMDGIGQVRVVKQEAAGRPYSIKKDAKNDNAETASQDVEEPFPEPPSSLLKHQTPDESVVAVKTTRLEPRSRASAAAPSPKPAAKPKEKVSLKERARQFVAGNDKSDKPERSAGKRVEPKLNEEQIRMDFDQNEQRTRLSAEKSAPPAAEQPQSAEPVEQEVLVLNVKMPDDKHMSGAALLPALLTLGFKFGEQDVFHRHANSNGKGPKLFSLANMFKPGTFNLDNMETFKTQGISLFMILPIEGDPQQVFNMMHNAARKLADEFGAQILDARRSLLTKQSLQQYVEKIREFERKRMINKV